MTTTEAAVFSFLDDDEAPAAVQPPAERTEQWEAACGEKAWRALRAAGEVAYHWTIDSDRIEWSENAAEILECDPARLATGRAFATFLDADNQTSRYDTVMHAAATDDGKGVPFQIEYKFRPEGRMARAAVWIEENGRWFGGADGRPVEAYGTLRRVDDRQIREQHLSFLGTCDPLTGLMNRGRMAEALGEAMMVASRGNGYCALAVLAIDNLAVVNETYGHEVGNEVVVELARRLREAVRVGDAIARYSGAKFGVILNSCSEEELTGAVERFLATARDNVIETDHGPVWALVSLGAIALPRHAATAELAIALAEEALAEAAAMGGGNYIIHRPSPARAAARNLNAQFGTEIVRCLRDEGFKLAFQPVIDAKTGKPFFHEALLRMRDRDGETIAAGHLIPVAEKLGLVRLIDRAVVQLAIATLATHPDARIAINLSGTTTGDRRWHSQIVDLLTANRGLTDRLIVEITESVALGANGETRRFIGQVHELGCLVAIDDCGAGQASFRQLRGLPVDFLKLDGAICRDLAGNADNQYFVKALIDLARKFGVRTVAEWVETTENADHLRVWGVDFLQGNLYGEASLTVPWRKTGGSEAFAAAEPLPFVRPAEAAFAADPVLAEEEPEPTPEPMMASAPVTAAPDDRAESEEIVAGFEDEFEGDLSKLRAAIAALDRSFRGGEAVAGLRRAG